MTRTDQRKLDDIADGFMESFPAFFRRATRGATCPSTNKFVPNRIVLKMVLMHGPLSMSMIGRHMGVSKPYMTALVDELINEGLVERVPDPDDRRVVNIRITHAGRQETKDFTRSAREAVIKNLTSLDADDVSTLHEMVRDIRRIITKLDQEHTRKRRSREDV